jgi:hypothetical protein
MVKFFNDKSEVKCIKVINKLSVPVSRTRADSVYESEKDRYLDKNDLYRVLPSLYTRPGQRPARGPLTRHRTQVNINYVVKFLWKSF